MPAKPVGPAARNETPAVEVEVLPPERASGSSSDALPRLIALLLDNLIKLPGTKRRMGLNPILDFLPGFGEVGDAAATLVSSLTILEGARRGLPKVVLARMAGNVLLNGLVGTIPFMGAAFSFWFRPSQRNYDLLRLHTSSTLAAGRRRSTAGDWLFVTVLLLGVLLIAGLFIGVGFYVSYQILKALVGG